MRKLGNFRTSTRLIKAILKNLLCSSDIYHCSSLYTFECWNIACDEWMLKWIKAEGAIFQPRIHGGIRLLASRPSFQQLSSNDTISCSFSQMFLKLPQTNFWLPLAWLTSADAGQSLCWLPSEAELTSEWQAAVSSVLQTLSSQLAT